MQPIKAISVTCDPSQKQAVCRSDHASDIAAEHHYTLSTFAKSVTANPASVVLFGWCDSDSDLSAQQLSAVRLLTGNSTYLVVVSATDDEPTIVNSLNLGADRFVLADTSTPLLDALIRTLAKKLQPAIRLRTFPPYQMNLMTREISVSDKKVKLTAKEYMLAQYLFENKDCTLSRSKLLRDVWDLPELRCGRRVDTKISHIRRKMHLDGSFGWALKFIHNEGYQLRETAQAKPSTCYQ